MQVRQYESRDLDGILSAWENASNLAHPFLEKEFLVQERKNIPEVYLPIADTWVVDIDNAVVGFIALIGNEVGAIFLQPECHGQGAGKALMDKARDLRGELEVEVFANNPIGRKFYAQYGFVLLQEKLHEQTGQQVLRLKYTAKQ
jgi:putative acetyltransferase